VEKATQNPKAQKGSFSLQNIHCLMTTSIDCRIDDASVDSLLGDESEDHYHYSSKHIASTKSPANTSLQSSAGNRAVVTVKPARVRVSKSAHETIASHMHTSSDPNNSSKPDVRNYHSSDINPLYAPDPWIRNDEVSKVDQKYVNVHQSLKKTMTNQKIDGGQKLSAVSQYTQVSSVNCDSDVHLYKGLTSSPHDLLPPLRRPAKPLDQRMVGMCTSAPSVSIKEQWKAGESQEKDRLVTNDTKSIGTISNEDKDESVRIVDIPSVHGFEKKDFDVRQFDYFCANHSSTQSVHSSKIEQLKQNSIRKSQSHRNQMFNSTSASKYLSAIEPSSKPPRRTGSFREKSCHSIEMTEQEIDDQQNSKSPIDSLKDTWKQWTGKFTGRRPDCSHIRWINGDQSNNSEENIMKADATGSDPRTGADSILHRIAQDSYKRLTKLNNIDNEGNNKYIPNPVRSQKEIEITEQVKLVEKVLEDNSVQKHSLIRRLYCFQKQKPEDKLKDGLGVFAKNEQQYQFVEGCACKVDAEMNVSFYNQHRKAFKINSCHLRHLHAALLRSNPGMDGRLREVEQSISENNSLYKQDHPPGHVLSVLCSSSDDLQTSDRHKMALGSCQFVPYIDDSESEYL